MELNNILVIDQSSRSKLITKKCFQREGLRGSDFFFVGGGGEAVDFLKKNNVDLVITDMDAPKCDGLCLMEHINSAGKIVKLNVIITTNRNDPNSTRGAKTETVMLPVHRNTF